MDLGLDIKLNLWTKDGEEFFSFSRVPQPVYRRRRRNRGVMSTLKEVRLPQQDVQSPLKEVWPPLKEVWSPLKKVQSSLKEVRSPLKEVRSPLKEVRSPLTEVLSTLKEARQPLRDVSRSPWQEVGRPWKNMRKPLKEARPPLLEDRKAKMKRARSPSLTSSPIPQLDGTCTPSTPKTTLLSRPEDTEEYDPEYAPEPEPETESAPEPEPETEHAPKPKPDTESVPEPEPETEPETESAPEPEPETEAGLESETEFKIELKPPVNIANPVFRFCEEKECKVCPVRHNSLNRLRACENVDNQINQLVINYRKFCCFSAMDDERVSCEISHWHSKSNLCLSYEYFFK